MQSTTDIRVGEALDAAAIVPSESPTSRIGRNTLLNLGGALIPALVALATVPVYLHTIGQARYGVLSVAWLFLGYFGVFNLGLGRATGNRIAQLRHAEPVERQRVFWTALALNAALGILGGLCLLLAGHLLIGHVLSLPANLRDEAVGGLPWLALGVPFFTISMVCVGALEGLERFGVVNALEVATAAVFQIAPLAVARTVGTNLTWLIAAAASAPAVGAALTLCACAWLLPLGLPPVTDRRAARLLFSYGGWVTLSGIVGPLLVVLDRFVIGAVSGARAVTQYTVPLGLVSRVAAVPASLGRSLFPRLSFLADAEAGSIARDSTRALAAVTTPLVVVGSVVAAPFLHFWVGGSLADRATPVAEIVLVGIWFNSLAFMPYTFLLARRRPDVPAKLHVLELPPYLLGLWLGLALGGIEGAAVAWTLRVTVDAGLLAMASRLYGRRELRLILPMLLVLAAYVAASVPSEGDGARLALGGAMAGLSLLWAWRERPNGFGCFAQPYGRRGERRDGEG